MLVGMPSDAAVLVAVLVELEAAAAPASTRKRLQWLVASTWWQAVCGQKQLAKAEGLDTFAEVQAILDSVAQYTGGPANAGTAVKFLREQGHAE